MQRMVAAGETDHLVPERSWQEISRGLMEQRPSRMLAVLRECDALAHVLPEVDALFGVPAPAKWHPEIDTGLHTLMTVAMALPAAAALKEGDAAPDFEARASLAGKAFNYSFRDALKKGPVVVYFWLALNLRPLALSTSTN